MHDAVNLEQRSLPTAIIVTEVFAHEAHMQRAALGMEALQPVVISHPLSTLTDEQIAGRAAEAAVQAQAIWLGKANGQGSGGKP